MHDSLICYGIKGNATIGNYVDVTPTGEVVTASSTSSKSATPTSTSSNTTTSASPQKTNMASVKDVSLFLILSISAIAVSALL